MIITRQVYRRTGSSYPKILQQTTEPIEVRRATEVLIKVHAVSLNYRDINILRGTNPWTVKEDGIPTSDAAGEVIDVGSEVEGFKKGDRVTVILDQFNLTGQEQDRQWLGGEVDGVLATHLVFPESKLVKLPNQLSFADAALLPNAGLTAYSALDLLTSVAGKTVLLQGTGGVSLMALKLAKAAGARVIITSSSDTKAQDLQRENPGIETINYHTRPDWHQEVLRLTKGEGVDIVVENGGAATMAQSIQATRRHGLVSSVGYLDRERTGDLKEVISLIIDRVITLRGMNVGSKIDLQQLCRLCGTVDLGLSTVIDRTFKFEEAAQAFEYLASGRHTGKIVIEIS